jgi:hypothetical protein
MSTELAVGFCSDGLWGVILCNSTASRIIPGTANALKFPAAANQICALRS